MTDNLEGETKVAVNSAEQIKNEGKPENAPERIDDAKKQKSGSLVEKRKEVDDDIARTQKIIEITRAKLVGVRGKLGLPQQQEQPPSIVYEQSRLERLQAQRETLEKQKEEVVSQQEKEGLVEKELERLRKEKVEELKSKFEVKGEEKDIFEEFRKSSGRNRVIFKNKEIVGEKELIESPSKSVFVVYDQNNQIEKIIAGKDVNIDEIIDTVLNSENISNDLRKKAQEQVEQKIEAAKQMVERAGEQENKEAVQESLPVNEEGPEKPKEIFSEQIERGQEAGVETQGNNMINNRAA